MSIRRRLFLTILLITGFGFYQLVDWILEDLRPRYLEAMEECMVDTSTLLAALISQEASNTEISVENLRAAVKQAQAHKFEARIYEFTKTQFNMRVYVVDRQGLVIYDSEDGRDEGKDYSQWNDIIRTFRGEYGARSTRDNPDDPESSVLYVAAPIRIGGEVAGVLTVAKPTGSVALFLNSAKQKIVLAAIFAAIVVVMLGFIITHWVTRPIRRLMVHAKLISDGQRPEPIKLGQSDIGTLATAFEEMRDALEGKQYIEHYVQALTHEMKSPLAAVKGAAELLEENMPEEDRKRFVLNIRNETERMRALIDRLLSLAALEGRKALRDVEPINLAEIVREIAESLEPVLTIKAVNLDVDVPESLRFDGERFLIRQTLTNILSNALEFVPDKGKITIHAVEEKSEAVIQVEDNGVGIPDYALNRVFERFYSLQRPDTKRKSSGLGLTFVREAIILHGGRVELKNNAQSGICVNLFIPLVHKTENQ